MAETVRDVMSAPPLIVGPQTSVVEVARVMRDEGIGTLLIAEGEELIGIVTDRDLAVRIITLGGNIEDHSVIEACSENLISISPDDDIEPHAPARHSPPARHRERPTGRHRHPRRPRRRTRPRLPSRRHQRRRTQPVEAPAR
ncbi:CBS domain-containing protein [Streptomyces pristinaespiralis]|uniref:CBS domain-containing protein n=1 Tax=Streptomyces pristinaespiralis TaxID=38300 RepID=UPI003F4D6A17